MRWLHIFRQVAQDHRDTGGDTPSRQLMDALLAVFAMLVLVIDLGIALIIHGGAH